MCAVLHACMAHVTVVGAAVLEHIIVKHSADIHRGVVAVLYVRSHDVNVLAYIIMYMIR